MFYRNALSLFFIILLLATHSAECLSPPYVSKGEHPWFTGPLITPSARLVAKGHVNLEPYLLDSVITGVYDSHWHARSVPKFYQWNPFIVAKIGIADRANLSLTMQSFHNRTRGVSGSGFGDTPIGLEIGLLTTDESDFPLKLTIQEVFPTGRYQHLNPRKFGTDITGVGAYTTIIGLTVSNLHHFSGDHYLQSRLNVQGGLSSEVHVKGLNSFGGDRTTRGRVFPGPFGIVNLGLEYTLTTNWALALDLVGQIFGTDHFRGHSVTHVGLPEFIQFQAAPAIEYNFNKNVGIIAGTIFSIAGKNAAQFVTAAVALNWYF